MQRQKIIEALKSVVITPEKVRIVKVDYTINPLSPEKVAYKVTGTSLGAKFRFMFYPNTVGFQSF